MFELTAYQLHITLEATETIALERYSGSSLRGALFEALLQRFCMNREASSCAMCPLNLTCPVAGLVAPLRDEHPRGRDVPRPFVIAAEPALDSASVGGASGDMRSGAALRSEVRLGAGETFTFAVTLFGRAAVYFPYLALGLSTLERLGIGRPLSEHRGRRGRPRIARIEAIQPFTGECETLYSTGAQAVRKPALVITPELVAAQASALPIDRMALDFTTPTRLIAEGRLLTRPDIRTLALRLVERLEALEQEYGGDAAGASEDAQASHARRRERYLAVERQARGVRVVSDETRWVNVTSYSARQRRFMPIGGFIGQATIEGELGPLRELLVWGEIAHAGKNAVKGDGCFHAHAAPLGDVAAAQASVETVASGAL